MNRTNTEVNNRLEAIELNEEQTLRQSSEPRTEHVCESRAAKNSVGGKDLGARCIIIIAECTGEFREK